MYLNNKLRMKYKYNYYYIYTINRITIIKQNYNKSKFN